MDGAFEMALVINPFDNLAGHSLMIRAKERFNVSDRPGAS
jgi:hypothetical protein